MSERVAYRSLLNFLWLLYLVDFCFVFVLMNASHFFFQEKESDKHFFK